MGSALRNITVLDPGSLGAAGDPTDGSAAGSSASAEALRMQVAERLAAHRDRRSRLSPPRQIPEQTTVSRTPASGDSRARIAATVAEYYAQSPSYRAFLAAEAKRAIEEARAAADIAALSAQAVAEAQQELLDSLSQNLSRETELPVEIAAAHAPVDFAAALAPTDLAVALASEIGPGFSPDIKATQNLGFSPRDTFSLFHQSQRGGVQPSIWTGSQELSNARKEAVRKDQAGIDRAGNFRAAKSQARSSPAPSKSESLDFGGPPSAGLTVRLYEDEQQAGLSLLQLHIRAGAAPQPATNGELRQHPEARKQDEHNDPEARALDEEISFRHAPVFEEPAGPPLPLPANLIEFPRQLVASRKARPRHAEGPLREEEPSAPEGGQLRIFEVDAAQISTLPEPADPPPQQWTSLWLDSPGVAPTVPEPSSEQLPEAVAATHPIPTLRAHPRPHTAAIARRLTAAVIDGCLILVGFMSFAATFAAISLRHTTPQRGHGLPMLLANIRGISAGHAGIQPAALLGGIAVGIAFFYLLYQMLFFSLLEATPGMRCTHIALCTFADENPTRAAMRWRILAVLLSACPLGLGFLWAALDEDRLTWHDRISRMYQRSY